jgi:hypothetical protein
MVMLMILLVLALAMARTGTIEHLHPLSMIIGDPHVCHGGAPGPGCGT